MNQVKYVLGLFIACWANFSNFDIFQAQIPRLKQFQLLSPEIVSEKNNSITQLHNLVIYKQTSTDWNLLIVLQVSANYSLQSLTWLCIHSNQIRKLLLAHTLTVHFIPASTDYEARYLISQAHGSYKAKLVFPETSVWQTSGFSSSCCLQS